MYDTCIAALCINYWSNLADACFVSVKKLKYEICENYLFIYINVTNSSGLCAGYKRRKNINTSKNENLADNPDLNNKQQNQQQQQQNKISINPRPRTKVRVRVSEILKNSHIKSEIYSS